MLTKLNKSLLLLFLFHFTGLTSIAQVKDSVQKTKGVGTVSNTQPKYTSINQVKYHFGGNGKIEIHEHKKEISTKELVEMTDHLNDLEKLYANTPTLDSAELDRISMKINTIKIQIAEYYGNIERLYIAVNKSRTKSLNEIKDCFQTGKLNTTIKLVESKKMEMMQHYAVNTSSQKELAEYFLILANVYTLKYSLSNRIDSADKYYKISLKCLLYYDNIHSYASFLRQQNKFDDALVYSKLLLSNHCTTPIDSFNVLTELGSLFLEMNNPDNAQPVYEEALNVIHRFKVNSIGYKKSLATTYQNLGVYYYHKHDWPKSFYNQLEGLKIWQEITKMDSLRYAEEIANAFYDIGMLYHSVRNYDTALNYFLKAKEIRRNLKKDDTIQSLQDLAQSYMSLGLVFDSKNKWDSSLYYYLQANEIINRLSLFNQEAYLPDKSNILSQLGMLYTDRSNLDTAKLYLTQSLSSYSTLFLAYPQVYAGKVGNTHTRMATLFLKLNYKDSAIINYNKALRCYQLGAKLNPDRFMKTIAITQYNIGNVFYKYEDWDSTLKYFIMYRQTLETLSQTDKEFDTNPIIMADVALGNLYMGMNKNDSAKSHFINALNSYRLKAKTEVDYKYDVATTLNSIGICYQNIGDTALSIQSYKESASILKDILEKQNNHLFQYRLSVSLLNLGVIYSLKKELDSSSNCYRECLEIRKVLCNQSSAYLEDLAIILDNVCKLNNLQNNQDSEIKYSVQAYEVYDSLFKTNPSGFLNKFLISTAKCADVHARYSLDSKATKLADRVIELFEKNRIEDSEVKKIYLNCKKIVAECFYK